MAVAQPLPAETSVSFKQDNPKVTGSKSRDRYEKYKSGKTVQEALDLGAFTGDIKGDYDKGHLTIEGEEAGRRPNAAVQQAGNRRLNVGMLVCVAASQSSAASSSADSAAAASSAAPVAQASAVASSAAADADASPAGAAFLPAEAAPQASPAAPPTAASAAATSVHYARILKFVASESASVQFLSPAMDEAAIQNTALAENSVKEVLLADLAPIPAKNVKQLKLEAVCGRCGDAEPEDKLLMCDGFSKHCFFCVHLSCLDPALESTPQGQGEWSCAHCTATIKKRTIPAEKIDGTPKKGVMSSTATHAQSSPVLPRQA